MSPVRLEPAASRLEPMNDHFTDERDSYGRLLVDREVWRQASRPLLAALQHGGAQQRPKLSVEQRTALLDDCAPDIAVLEEVLGESFQDWHSAVGRGSFAERVGS